MKIEDGKGTGKLAQVTDKNRLRTQSASTSELHENSIDEAEVYMFNTSGYITISTTGADTGVFHIINTSTTKSLFISSIRTCGNQIQKVKLYKNATTGTLISNAVAGGSCNLNFTSSNTASATIYKGADTYTVTNGTLVGQHINGVGHSNIETYDAMVLGRNDSLSITFNLASAGDVCVAVVGYFE